MERKIKGCEDCDLPYDENWLDTNLTNEQWKLISGYSNGEGILCAGCIVKRAANSKYQFVRCKMVFE